MVKSTKTEFHLHLYRTPKTSYIVYEEQEFFFVGLANNRLCFLC